MPIIVRISAVLTLSIAFLLAGCRPESKPIAPTTPADSISSVPLRLWIVGQVSDVSMIQRQWQTGSEQPVEIRTLTVDEFFAESNSNCDVLVYPGRLIGELIDRKWIIKLPTSLASTVNATTNRSQKGAANRSASQGENSSENRAAETDESAAEALPPAWQKSVTYNGELWGIPLGTTFPVVIASDVEQAQNLAIANWDELLVNLQIAETKPSQVDTSVVDRTALVDRFFAVAASLTERSPNYGVLFELQSMKPRLTEPEFIHAAEILARLASQSSVDPTASLRSVLGDSSEAWTWVASQDRPALAIVAPSMLNVEAAKQSQCRPISIQNSIAWNTGSGLITSMSANCRQSARAALLLRWLGESETRQSLAPLVPGIESSTPIAGTESTAWQAAGVARELAASERATHELRLSRAEEYRNALADQLVKVIAGESTANDALAAASSAWQAITESRGRLLQRTDYEHSLGLSHN